MNICATLKQNGVTPVTIGTKYLWTAAGWFDFLNLRVNGMDFHMELMDGKASYEDPRLDRVFEIWGEMANQGYFLENHATFSWQEAQAPMINGEAAMYLIGNFIVPSLKDAGVVDKVGYFQFPVINADVRTFEEAPTDTVHIPSGAKNKADAKRFLAFVARADINNQVATSIGNLPPNSKAPAPTDPFLKIGFKVLSESAGLAQFYDRDTTPEMAKEGMKGFQEFMVKPEREKQIRGRIEKARKRIFK
jgi:multiple sugar transport system substrate-binding protein